MTTAAFSFIPDDAGGSLFFTNIDLGDEWFNDINITELGNASFVQAQVSADTTSTVGLIAQVSQGVFRFIKALGRIMWIPWMLTAFGVPAPFHYLFSLPVYFLYTLALAQFIRNASLRGMS